jgi:hypothetical protein
LNVDGDPQFLNEVLPELVKEIPLTIRRKIWYLHDGALKMPLSKFVKTEAF